MFDYFYDNARCPTASDTGAVRSSHALAASGVRPVIRHVCTTRTHYRSQKQLQASVDKMNNEIEAIRKAKEKEVLDHNK